jgi:hypothetical protein
MYAIVNGTDRGHYHLLIGEKLTGKSSMLLDAVHKINGEGVSMFEAISALSIYHQKHFHEIPSSEILSEAYDRVGGRLKLLNRIAKSPDILKTCDNIIDVERRWFLNQCWILTAEMYGGVMDQQKYAVRPLPLPHSFLPSC